MFTATQKLQFQLRRHREAGDEIALPPAVRWRDGVPLWSEIIYCSSAEAAQLRDRAALVNLLQQQAPTIGLVIEAEFEQFGRQLAQDVEAQGYGGLVRFEDLETRDTFLRVMVGDGLYPLIVRQDMLKDFWMQLTLQCERHFLALGWRDACYGYWESDLVFAQNPAT
ncbi:MAG: hypothetical protein H7Y22_16640 [Gemmatimonadaceae bacterium]|nr:hypothetical protein [Gloeobacterales cyanobacterium ES-bin-141]